MKRILHYAMSAMFALSATIGLSQSKSYPLFEHFTQASCGPCAQQNPIFQADILDVYHPDDINHVAYHTSWPGTDPMYTHNTTENDARTSYYGVSGVPTMIMDGSNVGGPAQVTTDMVDNAISTPSPIKVKVSDVDQGGGNHDVTVEVFTTGTVSGSNLKLRAAIVEKDVNYSTPPGSNGETYFPNVFRKMLPNTSGDAYTPASCGNSVSFNYSYTMDAAWDPAQIYVVAWVQDDGNDQVLNSGSTFNPDWYAMGCDVPMVDGQNGVANNFNLDLYNDGTAPEQFRITLTHNAPAGWAVSFDVASQNYTSTADVTVAAGGSEAIQLNVTPDATPAWGEFTIEIESLDNPGDPHDIINYTVVSGITDLVVNNDESWGDGNTYDFEQDYIDGLVAAGNTNYAATSMTKFVSAINDGLLSGVNNVYFNVSWTFPSFTTEKVNALSTFLDNGGNLFVSGQDIGWDTWDANGNGVAATRSFYTNYLSADYVADGDGTNSTLVWNTNDGIFGTETNSAIVDAYPSGQYMYPDEIDPIAPAVSIYSYNTATGQSGGIRVQENGHKVVYIGVDLPMISDASVRDRVIWLSHDWFYGLVSTEEFDRQMAQLGQNYPNPATSSTTIPVTGLKTNVTMTISDVTGRIIETRNVSKGTTRIDLNTAGYQSGVYYYTITDAQGNTSTKNIQVVR